MATNPNAKDYILGRKKYARPQGMLWSENSGTLIDGLYVPNGYEINSDPGSETDTSYLDQFLILSDDGREPFNFKPTRLEDKKRMINGRMRSYHIADKISLSTSWNNLPSRSHNASANFNSATGISGITSYTTDGGAGGVELLDWYENHKGSFWVYLSYDKYTNFEHTTGMSNPYDHLPQYSQIIEMFISDFSYNVVKRGAHNHDLWTVSVSLEEV